MNHKKENIPMLIGFIVGNKHPTIHVWCPYCQTLHIHGATEDVYSRKGGHRIAHCFAKDSPFKKSSYYIKVMPIKFMQKFKKDMEELNVPKILGR